MTSKSATVSAAPKPPQEPNTTQSPQRVKRSKFIEVDGPVDPDRTLVTYDVPYAPDDIKKSLKLRQRLGLPPDTREVDPNVRIVIDSFLKPRTWTEGGIKWIQHASPYAVPRIEVVKTRDRLHQLMKSMGGQTTGVCPIRSALYAECFLELIRQVVAESWERGLLLLKFHSERVETMKAHRELFESRTSYAFRLALKGEKDTAAMVAKIEELKKRETDLIRKEEELKVSCETLQKESEETLLIDDKRYSDELAALKKEAQQKKNQLEALTTRIPKN